MSEAATTSNTNNNEAATASSSPASPTITIHLAELAPPREVGCCFIPRLSKYGLGIVLIICVTIIWVGSSEWIQFIFGALDFKRPYFLTFFNTTGFALWNLGYLVQPSWRAIPWDDEDEAQDIQVEDPAIRSLLTRQHPKHIVSPTTSQPSRGSNRSLSPVPEVVAVEETFYRRLLNPRYRQWCVTYDSCRDYSAESSVADLTAAGAEEQTVEGEILSDAESAVCVHVHRIRMYSLKKIWKSALYFCPFWFIANYLFNLSLSYTSVSSNTIMSSMGTVWTVFISRLFLNTPIGSFKMAGVFICVSGSIIVSIGSGGENGSSVLGNIIALLSSFFYAVYTIVLRTCLPDDNRYSMGMTFGAVGVINFFALWVGFPVLDYFNIEPFHWPKKSQLGPLMINALIGTNLSDVLWARSVILTSPIVATLGLSLTTPMSMVVDRVIYGSSYSHLYIIGAICVLCGFVVANIR